MLLNVLKDRDWSTVSCVDGLVERDSQGLRHRKEEEYMTANNPDSSHESRAMAGASAEGIVGVKKFDSLDERFATAHRPSSTSLRSSMPRTTRCRFFLLGFLPTIKPVRFCLEKVYSPYHLQGIMVKRTHRLFITEDYKNYKAISPCLKTFTALNAPSCT